MNGFPQEPGCPSLSSERLHACAPIGVSVVVCCYNSARRLPQTLAHLASQQVAEEIPWEVIVIDNASTDGTAEVAQRSWPQGSTVPLRIVHEPRLGLSYARARGFSEARYEIVSFVDDDNWVCPEWVRIVQEIMCHHGEVGACGGFIEAICEETPPRWFEHYKQCYAPGAQGQDEGGDVTWRGFLMGAGLTVRKSAWEQIVRKGFQFLLVDRQGTALTAGGDHELCFAINLAGWRLWYDPRLRLRHFLPTSRLSWRLLRLQARGAGMCEAALDCYRFALLDGKQEQNGGNKWLRDIRETWRWQMLVAITYLLRKPVKVPLSFRYQLEGDYDVLWIERHIGRLLGLIHTRKTYTRTIRQILRAPWKQTS
jgi:cellulose synthase/poly-beta-1,6-N-acetylglucosamine synthase-like glycosyltransferase